MEQLGADQLGASPFGSSGLTQTRFSSRDPAPATPQPPHPPHPASLMRARLKVCPVRSSGDRVWAGPRGRGPLGFPSLAGPGQGHHRASCQLRRAPSSRDGRRLVCGYWLGSEGLVKSVLIVCRVCESVYMSESVYMWVCCCADRKRGLIRGCRTAALGPSVEIGGRCWSLLMVSGSRQMCGAGVSVERRATSRLQ